MRVFLRTHTVLALLGATILSSGGYAAAYESPSAAVAASPRSSTAAAAPGLGTVLDNLTWSPMRTMSGTTVWMLRVKRDPGVDPGGAYFLWNPHTATRAGQFAVGDDVRVDKVSSWQAAIFRPSPDVNRIEVRYGDVNNPGEARVVATYATCPKHLTC